MLIDFLITLTFQVSDLVEIGFGILQWAIRYSYIFCLLLFALVMVKTLMDLVKKYSPPGGRKGKRLTG